ncbi:starvation-inducible DNA-binding protein [Deinobacterium chartae]|uniref:Starvation-inducible DNA-binding protein n=1 Tax=Deinobacterium chartae TaxID=521158 RepID=A0A841I428_9DEIO|nr:DNA starvation/stationary phase protection protein [Deinobacterium chartae]MBB6099170.1 starvation-inducible DNA-binding protein [Deinobacterium chartae]
MARKTESATEKNTTRKSPAKTASKSSSSRTKAARPSQDDAVASSGAALAVTSSADADFEAMVDHNYLSQDEFDAVQEALQRTLATTIALYLKFKKFHWDIRGRFFRELHLAYDEMAEEVFASIDVLAERLVMLGGSPVAAPADIERYSTVRVPTETIRDAREQLRQLVEDHNRITHAMRDDSKTVDDANDPATADIFNGLLHQHDEHRWMLQAILDDDRLD